MTESTSAGETVPPDRAPGAAHDPAGDLAGTLGGDPACEALFWRARADELATQLDRLQRRLIALGERLPARYAQLLACEPDAMPPEAYWPDPLARWHETTILEDARVASVLPRLWDRLDLPESSR